MPSARSRVAAETLRLLPRKRLSRALGRIAAVPAPSPALRQAIELYVRAYDVQIEEAEIPPDGFRTFDEFFTRRLKPGARPIAGGEHTLVSPADGRAEDVGPVAPDGARLHVKGQEYDVGELLGDPADAERFRGGEFTIIYLSPRDYHRVHACVSGPVRAVRHIGGTLLPVNAFGVRSFPRLFARNERVAVFQQTEAHGEVATVMIGAIGVGRISLSFEASIMTNVGRGPTTQRYDLASAPQLARGDELGIFHLGSTVVVLTTRHAKAKLRIQPGETVRVGQAIGGP